MKVILQKSVPKLGKTGDILEVNPGYAQNALFPKGLAIPATPIAIAALEKKVIGLKNQKEQHVAEVTSALATINDKTIIYTAKANAQGTLFSKIDATALAHFLEQKLHIHIDPKHITIDGGTIKTLGTASFTVSASDKKIHASLSIEEEK